jgi:hypothetical protein
MGNYNDHSTRPVQNMMTCDLRRDGVYWYIVLRVRSKRTGHLEAMSGPRHTEDISFWAVIKDMGALYRAIHKRLNG